MCCLYPRILHLILFTSCKFCGSQARRFLFWTAQKHLFYAICRILGIGIYDVLYLIKWLHVNFNWNILNIICNWYAKICLPFVLERSLDILGQWTIFLQLRYPNSHLVSAIFYGKVFHWRIQIHDSKLKLHSIENVWSGEPQLVERRMRWHSYGGKGNAGQG